MRVFLKILKEISKTFHAKLSSTGPGLALSFALEPPNSFKMGRGHWEESRQPGAPSPYIPLPPTTTASPLRAQRLPKDTGQLKATNMVCPWD